MTVTYCTAADVSSQLRLSDKDGRLVFSADTDPTLAEVEELINEMEDHIDSYCQDAWREVASEQYILQPGQHYMGWNFWENGVGLRHIGIHTLDKSKGDVLEVRVGNSWVDMLDGTHTEGVGSSYWLDYDMGILYLGHQVAFNSPSMVRLKYRYGHSTVPLDVKHACKLLAGAELLTNDFYAALLPSIEGQSNSRERTAQQWTDKAYDRLNRHRRAWIPLR